MNIVLINLVAVALGGVGAGKSSPTFDLGMIAQSAVGPFCPLDQKIYLDTSFFQDIKQRFRGCDVGSKSWAYAITHEVGHHVQNLLGILP